MEPKETMKNSIETLLRDIDRLRGVLKDAQYELDMLAYARSHEDRVLKIKEDLREIYARMEGIQEFMIACKAKMENPEQEEEIDLWM
jgi:hypothetical protein